MTRLRRVDHLNVQVPPEKEDEAIHFYEEILGLKRLKKPDSLGPAGAHFCISEDPWYELHVGVARDTSMADVNKNLRNHLGFQVDDLETARKDFEAAGIEIDDATAAYSESRDFHQERFFIRDPGGNRLEILEPRRIYASAEH
ncbi:MAG: VOC family protein [Alphaproteobacteria bacterium]|nr:VOC family protein [Alphaproteobacteria bacterium]